MADYQQALALGTIYRCAASSGGVDQLRPGLQITGGAVDIYCLNPGPNDAVPVQANMIKDKAAFGPGILSFVIVPTFLLVVASGGGAPVVISNELQAKAVS